MHQNNILMKYVRTKINTINDKIDANIIKPKIIVLYDSIKFPEFKFMIQFIENSTNHIEEIIDYGDISLEIRQNNFIREISRIKNTYTTHIALFAGITSYERSIAKQIIGDRR